MAPVRMALMNPEQQRDYDRMLRARKEWCPQSGRQHSFHDWGIWYREHRHPVCELCGFVDEDRTLPPLK